MTATWSDMLLVMILLLAVAGVLISAAVFRRNAAPPGLTRTQRDTLAYVQMLLNNYHAAHLQSPLSGAEIEEVLRLCEDKVGEVLS